MATNDKHTAFNRKFEIGILEVRLHTTILYSLSKIFKTNDTNVTIFTTKKLLSRLKVYNIDLENYKVIIKKDNESIRSYIKRVEVYCNKNIDVLFVNTIHETTFDLMCYLSFNPQCKTVLTVHHVNAWLRPEFVFDLLHILRTIDTIFSSILIKYFIFPKFDAINVIYPPLKDYIIKNIDFNKKIFTLPASVFEANNLFYEKNYEKKSDHQVLKVVVPGLIQEHRKDYETMIPVFINLLALHCE